MRVSTGAGVTTAPSIQQSAMTSGRGRGRGRGRWHDFVGGHGLFGGGRRSSGARLTVSDKGPDYVSTAKGLTTSLKGVGRNLVALNGHN